MTTTFKHITPRLNLNGTGMDDLMDPRFKAMDSLMDAIDALRQATPNGRDYPGDAAACIADRDEHYSRIGVLTALREALFAEILLIQRQGE